MKTARSKIMFYFDSPFYSGADMQAVRNAKDLVSAGHELVIVYRDSGNLGIELRERIKGPETSFFALKSCVGKQRLHSKKVSEFLREPFVFFASLCWAMRLANKVRPDVIHINNGGYPGAVGARGFALGSLLLFPATSVLFTVNNLAVPYSNPSRWLQAPTDFVLGRSKIVWITASRAAGARLSKVVGIRDKQLRAIRNGIEPLLCTCDGAHFDEYPEFDATIIVATQVGHLELRKGQLTLIESVNNLKVKNLLSSNWRFLLEGDGAMKKELQMKISEFGLESEVQLLGRVRCVFHLLARTNVLIHPSSSYEDLPNIISEAMSFGLPVIGSDVGGISEQVANSVSGIVVPPSDIDALSDAIRSLMSSEPLRARMGGMAYKRFLSDFSRGPALKAYRELYLNLKDSRND